VSGFFAVAVFAISAEITNVGHFSLILTENTIVILDVCLKKYLEKGIVITKR
jgi:hypothetical protein